MRRRSPRKKRFFWALGSLAAVLASACAGSAKPPTALVDGSPTESPPVRLAGVDTPVVMSRTLVVPRARWASNPRVSSCLRRPWSAPPRGRAVVRVGVDGESVTIEERAHRVIDACDGVGLGRTGARSCGLAVGHRLEGRLTDARLDLGGCRGPKGRIVAFAWIEPLRATRFVVLRHGGYAEVYETAAGVPVRIAATEGIDTARSRATFEVSEHGADGHVLKTHRLEANVSG